MRVLVVTGGGACSVVRVLVRVLVRVVLGRVLGRVLVGELVRVVVRELVRVLVRVRVRVLAVTGGACSQTAESYKGLNLVKRRRLLCKFGPGWWVLQVLVRVLVG